MFLLWAEHCCRYVSVWWAGVIGPHTGVCMLTSSLMHQLIGLLRQPDIFTHSQSLTHTHFQVRTYQNTHTHTDTHTRTHTMCNSYIHVYTECTNKHTCANTTMRPHAQAARRVYFQMNSLSQCWLQVKNDTLTDCSYCTHTYFKVLWK